MCKIAWRVVGHWLSRQWNPRNQMSGTPPPDNSRPIAMVVKLSGQPEPRFLNWDLERISWWVPALVVWCGRNDDNGPAWMCALLRNSAGLLEGRNWSREDRKKVGMSFRAASVANFSGGWCGLTARLRLLRCRSLHLLRNLKGLDKIPRKISRYGIDWVLNVLKMIRGWQVTWSNCVEI